MEQNRMSRAESSPDESHRLIDALASELAAGDPNADPRDLAQTCLRTIKESGFEILFAPGNSKLSQKSDETDSTVKKLQSARNLRLRELLDLWRKFSGEDTKASAELFAQIGERVLKSGEPLLAYDILKAGLREWQGDLRLSQLLSLSLARSGAPDMAIRCLKKLIEAGHEDAETLGLLARTHKDAWDTALSPGKRHQHLVEAHQLYRQGFDHALTSNSADGAIYAGINAATTALLLNESDRAAAIANQVAEICLDKPNAKSDYWAMATLGECALIARRNDDAATYYRDALQLAGSNHADISTTRRNAAMLLRHLNMDLSILSDWIPIPSVAVFTGHMIDQSESKRRFPPDRIEAVQEQIAHCLKENRVGFGFSSAACGGDLLFLEAMNQQGGEACIVLPVRESQFVPWSVDVERSRDWTKQFALALERAAKVLVVNDLNQTGDAMLIEYANTVMTGLAKLHAAKLGAMIIPIAVWDRKPARGPGGTGSLVDIWHRIGWSPQIIDPLQTPDDAASIAEPNRTNVQPGASPARPTGAGMKEIRAMMFGDVVGYSEITDEEVPLFIKEFMSRIADCVKQSQVEIETWNTWGDAIFFVFKSVEDAGRTALQITELVKSIDWKKRGFQRQLNIRTGLHVGPVYRVIDPVTQTSTHTGAHVSRAARIEPIAPPGEVYASEAFAAFAAVEDVKSFRCDYVGVTPMAKGYGDFPTYHVRQISDQT